MKSYIGLRKLIESYVNNLFKHLFPEIFANDIREIIDKESLIIDLKKILKFFEEDNGVVENDDRVCS